MSGVLKTPTKPKGPRRGPLQDRSAAMITTPSSVCFTPEQKPRRGPWATQITPYMFVGNRKDAADLLQLSENGVTHICNAADDVKNFFPQHFTYVNLNVADFGEDRGIGRVFKQAITFVAKVKEAKCRVLIHCFAGQNRSVTIAIASLMILESMTLRQAYELIAGRRPCACPQSDNRKELLTFEARLKRQPSMKESDFAKYYNMRSQRKTRRSSQLQVQS